MRTFLLAGTALALLASPAYAFNAGLILQFGNNNDAGNSYQLSPPGNIVQQAREIGRAHV